ncbi:hypothetical protein NIES970_02660 [[Synechococcus] sp. NIES-970]|nr:hypothetical protein NIES970_02660 [[Synechococcus] sp. NIES-970]
MSQGLPGIKIALKQLEFEKVYFNKKLQISDFKFLKTYYFEFRGLSGVAASSLISIEKDLLGNTVNNIDDFNEDLRLLFLSVFPQRDKTVLFLSFHKKEQVFKNLIKQIQKMRKIDQQIIFSNILLFYVENFVLSPCLWDSYSIQKQQDIQRVVSEIGEVNSNNLGQIKNINLFL